MYCGYSCLYCFQTLFIARAWQYGVLNRELNSLQSNTTVKYTQHEWSWAQGWCVHYLVSARLALCFLSLPHALLCICPMESSYSVLLRMNVLVGAFPGPFCTPSTRETLLCMPPCWSEPFGFSTLLAQWGWQKLFQWGDLILPSLMLWVIGSTTTLLGSSLFKRSSWE